MIQHPPVTGITSDSRHVAAGNMYVAITGSRSDGRAYISDAIGRGAKVIVTQKGTPPVVAAGVTWIETDNPRRYLAFAAAQFYGVRPPHIVAVTGTNGKTSTVNFCRQIWAHMKMSGSSMGTLGLIADNIHEYDGMTTPEPMQLHAALKKLADARIDYLAMEASSQGMDQYRLEGLSFCAAGFTNLTQDHLDYHGDMTCYRDAKLRLFSDYLAAEGTAIINADDTYAADFIAAAKGRNIKTLTYGQNGDDLRLIARRPVADGQVLMLELMGQKAEVTLPLVGGFQAMNVLCALGLVMASAHKSADDVLATLPHLTGIDGRLQRVVEAPNGIGVYIDFAHTPDGLENVLVALRPHTIGRLICIFGCGGDRDRKKRPLMGEIAARLADITIITDDNPRSENPAFIRGEIRAAAPDAMEIDGRRNAIAHAVQMLTNGDVLVIAGKGHEQGQIFSDHTEPFDDYGETRKTLTARFS